ncbi:MAG: DUF1580 domain-containing protein [Planctomycetota bacterium]
MLDVNAEAIVTLSQLAKKLPRRRLDRPVHPATIHRWRSPGVRGIRLECVRIGGTWHTSLEAYQRWVERLTIVESGSNTEVSSARTSPSEDAIDRELDERWRKSDACR